MNVVDELQVRQVGVDTETQRQLQACQMMVADVGHIVFAECKESQSSDKVGEAEHFRNYTSLEVAIPHW